MVGEVEMEEERRKDGIGGRRGESSREGDSQGESLRYLVPTT